MKDDSSISQRLALLESTVAFLTDTIGRQQLLLRGPDGKPRVEIGVDNAGNGFVHLYDSNGTTRIVLEATRDTPGIGLLGKDGIARVSASLDKESSPFLNYSSHSGRSLVEIHSADEPFLIMVRGGDGNQTFRFAVSHEGDLYARGWNRNGECVFKIPVT